MKKRRKKKEILQKRIFFLEEEKKKKQRVGRRILIGVIVANLNFSSGLVDVKLFCSGSL